MTESDRPQNETGDYAPGERQRNRTTIILFMIGFVICAWIYSSPQGAIALSIVAIVVAAIFWWLFASPTASKLDENSAGSGKRISPTTMGTILGYLYNGFKR